VKDKLQRKIYLVIPYHFQGICSAHVEIKRAAAVCSQLNQSYPIKGVEIAKVVQIRVDGERRPFEKVDVTLTRNGKWKFARTKTLARMRKHAGVYGRA
jgi:hypothetical protein